MSSLSFLVKDYYGITLFCPANFLVNYFFYAVMSSDEDFDMVTKALCEGACFFLHKPIRRWDIINVWQHVYRKRTFSLKIGSRKGDLGKEVPENDPRGNKITVVDSSFKNIERNDFLGTGNKTTSIDRRGKSRIEVEGGLHKVCGNQDQESPREARIASVERGNQGMPSRKRGIGTSYGGRSEERSDSKGLESVEDGSEGKDSDDDSSSLKKWSRMKWTPSLHLKFLDAVSSMGDGSNITLSLKFKFLKLCIEFIAFVT